MTTDPNSNNLIALAMHPVIRIGALAPEFSARSTKGSIRLADYRGQWLVFFSHPGAFTPVCTSEFVAFARAAEQFSALNCKLLGHSVDSLFANLGWMRSIHDDFGIEIPFPVIEDPSLVVAHAYGMIDDSSTHTAPVRACYFIDPEGRIAAMTAYPVTVGRSMGEILRIVEALQRTHSGTVMTPVDWRPGDDVLDMPSIDTGDVVKAEKQTGWFYSLVADPGAQHG
jgi:peroxiredoxin (alkyl hydroperoxide reductase subunit C)